MLEVDGVARGGVVGATIPYVFDSTIDIYQTLLWYVDRGYGKYSIALIKELEIVLHNKGVQHLMVSNMTDNQDVAMGRLLNRYNFKHIDSSYIKSIGDK